jgi:hypothetical protein
MLIVAVLVAALAGYGLYWYAPWTRMFDTTVNDPLTARFRDSPPNPDPTRTTDTSPYRVLSGTFVSQQHKTSGTVRVIRMPQDWSIRLELIDLDTSNGPDLQVWLSDQPVKGDKSAWRAFDTGPRVELGVLKGNKGNQAYDVPRHADLTAPLSVVIWSGRYDVAYGAAALG